MTISSSFIIEDHDVDNYEDDVKEDSLHLLPVTIIVRDYDDNLSFSEMIIISYSSIMAFIQPAR